MPNYDTTLNLPDTNLSFFAYGIFKPGQLAYSKIKNHVDEEKIENIEINYPMKLRDGIPILINREDESFHTQGTLLTFRKGQEMESYDIIRKTLSNKLYKWKTIRINEEAVNILIGLDPDYGSDYIENPKDRICFDGKNDPLFKEAMELIEENLKSSKPSMQAKNFFELQMNYLLLWSAIERFSSIKYNKGKMENNRRFAKQKMFRESIMKFKDNRHQPVFSSDTLDMHEFNAYNPVETINYYYTFRCNIVHRGKSMYNDYDMLQTAAIELLEIFKAILDDTFKE